MSSASRAPAISISCVHDLQIVVDHAQQIFGGDGIADEFFILFIPDLVGHHPDPLDTKILCQPKEMSENFFIDLKLPTPNYNIHVGSGSHGRMHIPPGKDMHGKQEKLQFFHMGGSGFCHELLGSDIIKGNLQQGISTHFPQHASRKG